ncbi:MAG: PCMD domain-containing protein, partial [Rikenellaceae bacterium]
MKKIYGYLAVVLMFTTMFTACNKDEKVDNTDYAKVLNGVFRGEMSYPAGEKVQTRVYLQNGTVANQIDVTILDYHLSPTEIVNVVVKNAAVTKIGETSLSFAGANGSVITKAGAAKSITVKGSADIKATSVTVEVTIDGVKGGSMNGTPYVEKGEAKISSVALKGVCVISSELDIAGGIIKYSVPSHSREADLKAIVPTIVASEGATWAPKTGKAIDFVKDESIIVVTSEDGKITKEYTFKKTKVVATEDSAAAMSYVYGGDMIVSLSGAANPAVKQHLTIYNKAEVKNMVGMAIRNFTFAGANIGDIVVNNIALYKKDAIINLSGDGKVAFDIAGQKIDANVFVTGEYKPSDGTVSLNIDVQNVPGLAIVVTYKGKKEAEATLTEPISIKVTGSDCMFAPEFKKGDYKYYSRSTTPIEEYKKLKVEIVLPAGATMKFLDPVADYTETTVYFDVTPANGGKSKRYTIKREEIVSSNTSLFSFEDWTESAATEAASAFDNLTGWQSPNSAVRMIKVFSGDATATPPVPPLYPKDGEYTVQKVAKGKVGMAAKMVTLDTKGGLIFGMVKSPKVTSGNIFTGAFNAFAAMTDPMLTTEFGLPYDGAKVLSMSGWYKYTPGAKYYDGLEEKQITDQASIAVVLYEVTDAPKFVLTGNDIHTSPRIVAVGTELPAAVND